MEAARLRWRTLSLCLSLVHLGSKFGKVPSSLPQTLKGLRREGPSSSFKCIDLERGIFPHLCLGVFPQGRGTYLGSIMIMRTSPLYSRVGSLMLSPIALWGSPCTLPYIPMPYQAECLWSQLWDTFIWAYGCRKGCENKKAEGSSWPKKCQTPRGKRHLIIVLIFLTTVPIYVHWICLLLFLHWCCSGEWISSVSSVLAALHSLGSWIASVPPSTCLLACVTLASKLCFYAYSFLAASSTKVIWWKNQRSQNICHGMLEIVPRNLIFCYEGSWIIIPSHPIWMGSSPFFSNSPYKKKSFSPSTEHKWKCAV